MVTKNKLAVILTLIAATIFGLSLEVRLNKARVNKIIDVPVTGARYSDGNILESRGFSSCSAVILDYKNKAVMAHAPNSEEGYSTFKDKEDVYVENVVEYLSNKMREKGINPRECKAFVNAGSNEGLEKITNDLRESGIEIESSKLDKNSRDIKYNLKTDKISINYLGNQEK